MPELGSKANHHFIPQFYLRGFADGLGRQARLFAFDFTKKRSFTTHVRNVGSRRYFNRIEAEGVSPDAVEDALAKLEGEIAGRLTDVVDSGSFPTAEHANAIFNLIANVSVRNPRLRENISGFHKDMAMRMMDLSLASEERWNSICDDMKREGVPVRDDLTYADLKEFHESGEYEIVIDQNYLIGLEMKMLNPVLECLSRRRWCFISSPEGSDFITSDDPVVLSWRDEKHKGFYSPGHGLPDTVIFFPLGSRLALMGAFEELPERLTYRPYQVAALNAHIARYSASQIYARDGNFRIDVGGMRGVPGRELPRFFKG